MADAQYASPQVTSLHPYFSACWIKINSDTVISVLNPIMLF